MHFIILSAIFAFAQAFAHPADSYDDWKPPGTNDVRGPCPMLNTLANHGFLPRNGKDISKGMAIQALDLAINWDASVVDPLFDFAQPTNPDPNATTINLDELTTHNILEHDGSLSRQDAHFGRADIFNEEAWNETASYFRGPYIDVASASKARTARLVTSASTNTDFTLPQVGANFIYGETAAYQFVFGKWDLNASDPTQMILTPKALVEDFFRNERLPRALGWKRPGNTLSMDTLIKLTSVMRDTIQGQMNGTID